MSRCRCWRRRRSPQTPDGLALHGSEGLRRSVSYDFQSIDLENLDFVFACCDVNRTGNLSITGVKHALRACGLVPDDCTLRRYLPEGGLIDSAAFKHLLQALQECLPDTMRSPAEVPHAIRGMRLDQLEHIKQIFITTGWLEQQCSAFNLQHQAEISAGAVHAKDDSLYSIDEYIVRPLTQPGPCIPSVFCRSTGNPIVEARRPCSYSELLHPTGCFVNFFVSHFWGFPFCKSLRSMKAWSTERCGNVGVVPECITFWICLFAINQHKAAQEVGTSPQDGPFNAALAHARGGAVMILDQQALPLKRLWCIFEVHRITELGQAFELITEEGDLSTIVGNALEGPPRHAALECLTSVGDALLAVSASRATASKLEDKLRICYSVCSNYIRNTAGECLDPAFYEHPYSFIEFDDRVRSLLANVLLQESLSREDWNGAFKWCVAGAAFGRKELVLLEEKNVDLMAKVQGPLCGSTLLTSTAGRNNLDAVQWLIERRADLGVYGGGHADAMSTAACHGHSEMVQLLFDGRASIETRETMLNGTPIHAAAGHNRFGVVGVLLECRADIEARMAPTGHVFPDMLEAYTTLQFAALFNSVQSAQLLLNHKADMESVEPFLGNRPLHICAIGGFLGILELLLCHGAQVDARSFPLSAERPPHIHPLVRYPSREKALNGAIPGGRTALMIAACCGHLDACKLLVRNGADIDLRDERGRSALDLVLEYRDDCRGGDETVEAIVQVLANGGRFPMRL